MKLRNCLPGVIAAVFLFTAPAVPAHASSIGLDIEGVLGPVLAGSDRIGLSGLYFSLTGVIDQDSSPVRVTADSATYNLPEGLEIAVGNLVLTGYNATLTLTDPAYGPDMLTVAFGVTEFNFTPDAWATLFLPAGTLDGTGLQDFWAYVSQPDSTLSYSIPGVDDEITATLGVTGIVSMSGGAPSNAPEPTTIGLLAGGLLAVALHAVRLSRT